MFRSCLDGMKDLWFLNDRNLKIKMDAINFRESLATAIPRAPHSGNLDSEIKAIICKVARTGFNSPLRGNFYQ